MASRTPYTSSALEVLTSANFELMPKGAFGYATSSTPTTGVASETDLTDLSVTVTVGANRLIQIEVYVPRVSSLTAADVASLRIKESSTELQEARVDVGGTVSGANGGAVGFAVTAPFSPSAGAHTYKATGDLAAGTGTIQFRCTATALAYIRVIDVGPSF